MFEEKENRYRLVCLTGELDKVIKNIGNYNFLKIVGKYEKEMWTNIIVDSDKELDYNYVRKFDNEIGQCLGAFEDYEQYYD